MATRGLDHWGDIVVVVIYFLLIMAVGIWSLCRPNRGTVKSYFLAGRNMLWWPVGASLFSSNIGSEHFIGLAGTGAASGIAIVLYEWLSMPLVLFLAWFFLPVYISARVYTLPEYMEKRFKGPRIRIYLSVLSLILYIVTKLAVSIYAGALFIQLALGWNMYISIVALLVITGLYTIIGGLAAVIYTDTFQTAVMTVGAFALVGISFHKIGGYDKLEILYMKAVPEIRNENTTCGVPRNDAFHIFRDPVHSDNPWPGLVMQASLGCLWYWCCDQVIVQRSLAAKNLSHAKGGSILAGYLKLLPLFIMIFPGMISRALYPEEVGCVDSDECLKYCDNPVGCSNIAYPKLVLELLPPGVRGLLMAVMLSAIMSSLTSVFNSSSTIFTLDLWRRMRPRANERELLIVGRVFVVIMCGVSILWIPLVRSSQGGQLFIYIQAVQGYLGTPIGALFFWSVIWKRINEHGAFWGVVIGHACGVIRMAVDFAFPAPDCGEADRRPAILYNVHYTYYGVIALVITSTAMIIISLLTKPQPDEELEGVTWWTSLKESDLKTTQSSESDDEDNSVNRTEIEMTTSESRRKRETRASLFKRLFDTVCGIPETSQSTTGSHLELSHNQSLCFLHEHKTWATFLNTNAIFALIVVAFLCGFYR